MLKVSEYLLRGAENAVTGGDLAILLGVDIRTVTALIEKERREGSPICATQSGTNAGYYLADDFSELDNYIRILKHRENELHKTGRALQRIKNLFS